VYARSILGLFLHDHEVAVQLLGARVATHSLRRLLEGLKLFLEVLGDSLQLLVEILEGSAGLEDRGIRQIRKAE
jgi:hypothetical protein